jgi:hypothetical protein
MPSRIIRLIAAAAAVGMAVVLPASSVAQASPGSYFANPSFESGTADWVQFSTPAGGVSVINNVAFYPTHTGSWKAELGGRGYAGLTRISQQLTVPARSSATVSFWLWVVTPPPSRVGFRELTVEVTGEDGTPYQLTTRTNKDSTNGYKHVTLALPSVFFTSRAQRVTVTFFAIEDAVNPRPFLVDDVSFVS